MADEWLDQYAEAIDEFPTGGSPSDKLRAALALAIRAPSVHNTQPWKCRISRDTVDFFIDESRALPVSDPYQRELTISVGGFVEHLRIVLRRFGYEAPFELLPSPRTSRAVARVTLGEQIPLDHAALWLADAIGKRQTVRKAFRPTAIPERTLAAASEFAANRNTALIVLRDTDERRQVAELVSEADRTQMASPEFRRELAHWLRPFNSRKRDGIPAVAGKGPAIVRAGSPLVVRTFDLGDGIAAIDQRLVRASPILAIIATRSDDRMSWLQAGRALAAVLLILAAEGVSASFLNQATEVPETRARLAERFCRGLQPQVVIRAGFGPAPTYSAPRRPLGEILRV